MPPANDIPAQLLDELRRDRDKIAAELPELMERRSRLDEAASENSLSGHLRRAVHGSGLSLRQLAAQIGLDVFTLCDFLEGTRTLRSDVLDRLALAIGVIIHFDAAPPKRSQPSE